MLHNIKTQSMSLTSLAKYIYENFCKKWTKNIFSKNYCQFEIQSHT